MGQRIQSVDERSGQGALKISQSPINTFLLLSINNGNPAGPREEHSLLSTYPSRLSIELGKGMF
jgi:hypothetical protein